MSGAPPAMDGTSGKHSRQEEKTLARKRGINRSGAPPAMGSKKPAPTTA